MAGVVTMAAVFEGVFKVDNVSDRELKQVSQPLEFDKV